MTHPINNIYPSRHISSKLNFLFIYSQARSRLQERNMMSFTEGGCTVQLQVFAKENCEANLYILNPIMIFVTALNQNRGGCKV